MRKGHSYGNPSKYSDEWYTPPEIPASLGCFDIDPCAGPSSHAKVNITQDGLSTEWSGRVWLNPPYSNSLKWLQKLADHGNGIALVPARPETKWFQEITNKCDGVFLIRRRIKFGRPDGKPAGNSPVGSVLFAFGESNAKKILSSGIEGIFLQQIK